MAVNILYIFLAVSIGCAALGLCIMEISNIMLLNKLVKKYRTPENEMFIRDEIKNYGCSRLMPPTRTASPVFSIVIEEKDVRDVEAYSKEWQEINNVVSTSGTKLRRKPGGATYKSNV